MVFRIHHWEDMRRIIITHLYEYAMTIHMYVAMMDMGDFRSD